MVMSQGTWFYFIGTILLSPDWYHGLNEWNQEDHEDMMMVTNFFGLTIIGVCLFQVKFQR